MLEYVGADKVDVLAAMETARIAQAAAEAEARAARDESAAAEEAAEAAKSEADAKVAVQQGAKAEIEAQKAVYEEQFEAANVELLRLQGARNAHQAWEQQKAAEEAAQRAAAERAAAEAAAAAAAARNGSSAAPVPADRAAAVSSRVLRAADVGTGLQLLRPALGDLPRRRGHRRAASGRRCTARTPAWCSAPARRPASATPSTSWATTATSPSTGT